MGAIVPLSVLMVAMVGFAIIAVTVVRIALLERKVLVPQEARVSAPVAEISPLALPGAAAA